PGLLAGLSVRRLSQPPEIPDQRGIPLRLRRAPGLPGRLHDVERQRRRARVLDALRPLLQTMPRATVARTPEGASEMNEVFRLIAHRVATAVGSPWAFIAALIIILAWLLCGPIFHFSDTWQLVINTATTIITFLMVFLIQNTQNRDAKVLHLKLDEL